MHGSVHYSCLVEISAPPPQWLRHYSSSLHLNFEFEKAAAGEYPRRLGIKRTCAHDSRRRAHFASGSLLLLLPTAAVFILSHPWVSLAATSLPSACSRGLLFLRGAPDMICSANEMTRGTKMKTVPTGRLRAHRGGDIPEATSVRFRPAQTCSEIIYEQEVPIALLVEGSERADFSSPVSGPGKPGII